MAGEWSTPITVARFCGQGRQQATGAQADLHHGFALRHQGQQPFAVIGHRQQGTGQVVPLAGMAVEKFLAAPAPFIQHQGDRRQVLRPFRQPINPLLDSRADGGEERALPACPVVAPGPLALDREHTGLGQDLEVPRDARLPHPEDGGQLLHGEFTGKQHRHQAQAAGIGKGFEGV